MPSTINSLKDLWVKFFPQYPFEYSFLDESIDKMYKSEERYSKVISTFSVVALFIACLGLLGLASFVTEQRRKEIGIRKVQGASIKSIVQLVSSEFMILVIVSNVIAWPVAYFFMKKWLISFAYRIDISLWTFIGSGVLTLLIALITVSFQAIKAAVANPVKSLD
jgi:putative ABC transport system permease protein